MILGAPKHLVVVPLEEETVKGKGHEELLSESYRSLGLKGVDGVSTLLKWDYSPAGTRPGKSEGGNGGLFTGEEYLVIVSLSLHFSRARGGLMSCSINSRSLPRTSPSSGERNRWCIISLGASEM